MLVSRFLLIITVTSGSETDPLKAVRRLKARLLSGQSRLRTGPGPPQLRSLRHSRPHSLLCHPLPHFPPALLLAASFDPDYVARVRFGQPAAIARTQNQLRNPLQQVLLRRRREFQAFTRLRSGPLSQL